MAAKFAPIRGHVFVTTTSGAAFLSVSRQTAAVGSHSRVRSEGIGPDSRWRRPTAVSTPLPRSRERKGQRLRAFPCRFKRATA
jgi:hypothetical protein